jgi:hypothetical protein
MTTTKSDLKFDELCNKLLQQDKWKKQFGHSNEAEGTKQAFATNVKGKGKWPKKKGKGSSDYATKSLQNITCQCCGKMRIVKKHCRKRLVNQKTNQGGPRQEAHVTENK